MAGVRVRECSRGAGARGRAGKVGEVRGGDSQGCAHIFLPKRIRHMVEGVGERGQEQGFCKCKTFWLLFVVQRACCEPAAEGAPCLSSWAPTHMGAQRGSRGSWLQLGGNQIWEEGRHGDVKHCLNEGQSYLK